MTIRLRLIGLVVIANIFLIFSLVYVNIRFAEIDAIRDEQLLLTEMRQTLNAESRGLMDFLISSFNTSIEEYQLLSSATDTAFESGRNNIVILPDMDDVVSKALDSVFGLNDLMIERREEYIKSAGRFRRLADENYPNIRGVSVFRIVTEKLPDDTYDRARI